MNAAWIVLAIGGASVLAHIVRRKWIDAVLVVVASAALAGMIGGFSLPAQNNAAQAPLTVEGDGLSAAQWRDMPARAIAWAPPQSSVLRLDFPRRLTLGRMFALTVHRSEESAGRLQLLAENDQVIAEASGSGNSLTVQCLPPVAEAMVLKARLLDSGGKVVAQGPVPVTVIENKPLQVLGRFAAPSFDTRVLNELLANSRALVDWQVTLGKTVTRSETAREKMTAPDLLVADAAYLERMPAAARGALLERVAAGAPLIVLASNAGDAAFWARAFQLNLRTNDKESVGAPLAMTPAPLNPASKAAGAWTSSDGMAWVRQWKKGRIVWLGAADWHRYAISEPRALGLWWQQVLDTAGVRRIEDIAWLEPEEMPLAGRRLEVCAQNVRGDVAFPGLAQTLAWQRRPERADASCVAVWPKQAGWITVEATDAKPHALYVYDKADWPLWQKAQRREATARYAARTPAALTAPGATPLPAWPFALLFTLAMLGLWWRERR